MSIYSTRQVYRLRASIVAISVLGITACGTANVQEAGTVSTESATSTQSVNLDSIADTKDPRNLTALSTHIFTGQVNALAGSESLNTTPETQFSVTVGTSLKGSVPKQVVVNQQGGTQKGIYISFNGDKPLTVGQWYLFSTRILERKNWYTTIPVDGSVPISAAEATNKLSAPLARLTAAIAANPQARIIDPQVPNTPTLTFPTPTPGEENPPPPSPRPTS